MSVCSERIESIMKSSEMCFSSPALSRFVCSRQKDTKHLTSSFDSWICSSGICSSAARRALRSGDVHTSTSF